MKTEMDTSLLEDALGFVTHKARHDVLDSLACYLHNTGYALQGNTEANDVEWFARRLWDHNNRGNGRWDLADDADTWRAIARVVVAALPDYQMRVAHRLIELSKVVRDIERAERSAQRDGRVSTGRGAPNE